MDKPKSFCDLYAGAVIGRVLIVDGFSEEDLDSLQRQRLKEKETGLQVEILIGRPKILFEVACEIEGCLYEEYLNKVLGLELDEENYTDYLTDNYFAGYLVHKRRKKESFVERIENEKFKEAAKWQALTESFSGGTSALSVNSRAQTNEQSPDIEPAPKFSIPTYALFHVYLSIFQGQGVTQQNKNELVKKYGHNSGAQLRNEFTHYLDEDRRMTLNTTSKTSAETHLLRFKNILPMLKEVNLGAFEQAEKDLRILKQQYKKHFS